MHLNMLDGEPDDCGLDTALSNNMYIFALINVGAYLTFATTSTN